MQFWHTSVKHPVAIVELQQFSGECPFTFLKKAAQTLMHPIQPVYLNKVNWYFEERSIVCDFENCAFQLLDVMHAIQNIFRMKFISYKYIITDCHLVDGVTLIALGESDFEYHLSIISMF